MSLHWTGLPVKRIKRLPLCTVSKFYSVPVASVSLTVLVLVSSVTVSVSGYPSSVAFDFEIVLVAHILI